MQYGPVAEALATSFDYSLESDRTFVPFDLAPLLLVPFRLGVVVGPSGSGKSQALAAVGQDALAAVSWDPEWCVADHFASPEEAVKALGAAGLNSVPQWMKPYQILSNGERHRADLARIATGLGDTPTLVDEFTSVVDRTVAMSLCVALDRHLSQDSCLVLATCHYDVLDWLTPDWVVDTATNTVRHNDAEYRKPAWRIHVNAKVGEIVCD